MEQRSWWQVCRKLFWHDSQDLSGTWKSLFLNISACTLRFNPSLCGLAQSHSNSTPLRICVFIDCAQSQHMEYLDSCWVRGHHDGVFRPCRAKTCRTLLPSWEQETKSSPENGFAPQVFTAGVCVVRFSGNACSAGISCTALDILHLELLTF